MDQPQPDQLTHIRLNAEEMSRLYQAICDGLAIAPQRSELIADCARAAARGLSRLGDRIPHASEWQKVFADFSQCNLSDLVQPRNLPATAKQHELAWMLGQQPAAFLSAREQEVCEEVAALALMQLMNRSNRALPALFSRGLRKIYTTNDPVWKAIRKEMQSGLQLSPDFVNAQPKGIRQTFVVTFNELLKRGIPEVRYAFPASFQQTAIPDQLVEVVDEPDAVPNVRLKKPVDLSPNFELLQLVRRDDDFAPPLNGFRVGFEWDALHPNELMPVLARLGEAIKDSKPENLPRRLEACAAIVALFARTSFERCMRIPIVRRGTLHLDLKCGFLRKRLDVFAKRTDC